MLRQLIISLPVFRLQEEEGRTFLWQQVFSILPVSCFCIVRVKYGPLLSSDLLLDILIRSKSMRNNRGVDGRVLRSQVV